MILTNEDLRVRAKVFAERWHDAAYERGETQSFYNDFFAIFGVDRKRVAGYEKQVRKLGNRQGFVDLFWPGNLLVEQKSAGRDLIAAETQAFDYFHGLKDDELPTHVLICDFQTWRLVDLGLNETHTFTLSQLSDNIHHFGFVLGRRRTRFKDQDPVNIKAAELVGHLHDALEAAHYTGHDLEQFLVRIVFCLFADDTGIFEPKDILWDFLETETAPDGSETGPKLAKIFEVLDTDPKDRSPHLAKEYAQFPHVNGALFATPGRIPDFDADMHTALLNACRFDWTPISPAIFGSLFQSVMDPVERREKGAHYTTEKNIMKVIEPLFLDDLRTELRHIKRLRSGRRQRLEKFQAKLSTLTFFDPACGCGNFLIIAYRELRLLELEVMRAIRDMGQLALLQSVIDVDQFYGIEYEEFPARIAETALWMMDHIMNRKLSEEFGELYTRIPLRKKPTILHGDALEVDWAEVLDPTRCSYVLGNPPFIGHHLQTTVQKEQLRRTYGKHGKTAGVMDYVTAWFVKAARYIGNEEIKCGFVATNSISQGEQVGILWRALAEHKLTINFAHRTFRWDSEARGKAAVYCVIIGFSKHPAEVRRLFEYQTVGSDPQVQIVEQINPYLVAAPWVLIENLSKNPSGMPEMKYGSKPTDGGHFFLTDDEKRLMLSREPHAGKFIYRFLGAKEFLNNFDRWIIWLADAEPNDLAKCSAIKDRIAKVSTFRKESKAKSTRDYQFPTLFRQVTQPKSDYILVPIHTSEKRDYIPFGFIDKNVIVGNSCFSIADTSMGQFGLIQSKMHMAWVHQVCGRLEGRYRYSKDIVYNTFPLPKGDLSKLDPLAQAVLDARTNHPDATLADLYDPDLMPPDLRSAHSALDRAVDAMYRRSGFASDRERVEHLFQLYEQMVKPLLAGKPKRKRRG